MSGLERNLLPCSIVACTSTQAQTPDIPSNCQRSLSAADVLPECSMHRMTSAGRPERCLARSLIIEQGSDWPCCISQLRAYLLCLGRVHLAAWCPH